MREILSFATGILPGLMLAAAVANIALSAFAFLNARRESGGGAFTFASAVISLWTVANLMIYLSPFAISVRFAFSLGAMIFPSLLAWVFLFTGRGVVRLPVWFAYALGGVFAILPFTGDVLLTDIVKSEIIGFEQSFGPLFPLYLTFFFTSFATVVATLLHARLSISDPEEKVRLNLILSGFLLFGGILLTVNFILPEFGIVHLIDFDVPSSIFLVGAVAYGMARYNLFNSKIITAHALVIVLWGLSSPRLLESRSLAGIVWNTASYLFIVLVGLFLIYKVNEEVAARRESQRLLERLRDFVSFATHELRGPVANFRGAVSMLFEGDYGALPAKTERLLKKLFVKADDMGQIIDDFLAFNKIESGQFLLQVGQGDLVETARAAVEDLKYEAERKNIYIRFEGPETLPHVFDVFKLKHVFRNLLDNAVKYGVNGGTVRVSLSKTPSGWFVFSVRDSGIGLSPAVLLALFNRYGPHANRTPSGSTIATHGIGLWLSREIVKLHDGFIVARSNPDGAGSEFSVWLPETPETGARIATAAQKVLLRRAVMPVLRRSTAPSCRVVSDAVSFLRGASVLSTAGFRSEYARLSQDDRRQVDECVERFCSEGPGGMLTVGKFSGALHGLCALSLEEKMPQVLFGCGEEARDIVLLYSIETGQNRLVPPEVFL